MLHFSYMKAKSCLAYLKTVSVLFAQCSHTAPKEAYNNKYQHTVYEVTAEVSPGALQTLCGCPPSWQHQGEQAGWWTQGPWTHRGWEAESRSFWKLLSHVFQAKTVGKTGIERNHFKKIYRKHDWRYCCRLNLCTWKWGSLRMQTSSCAAWLWDVRVVRSLRMSCTNSKLLSLTASNFGSS